MSSRTRAGILAAVPLFLTSFACGRAPSASTDPHADCPSLDPISCRRARALSLAASTYADEAHEYVFPSAELPPNSALVQTHEGWRPLPLACVRAKPAVIELTPSVIDYAFVGVVVDGTLVSADADIGPLLARTNPAAHDVRLSALAFVHDRAPPPVFDHGDALLERPNGDCTCGEATHFAGATKYGAMLSYAFRSARHDAHVRAIDLVRAALGDRHVAVHESQLGRLKIEGLDRLLAGDAVTTLAFQVSEPAPIAYIAAPIDELCSFAAPELTPSPLDFGVAPYGTEAQRTVRATNHAPIDLRALLGADTILVPAQGEVDLPLHWTPDGDAPGCETQTRDETIPFLRVSGGTPRLARVLETIRTGRPTAERIDRIEATYVHGRTDLAPAVRDWSCPHDFVRRACRAENARGAAVIAEPRGTNACHFECGSAGAAGSGPACSFDARMICALDCPENEPRFR